MLVSENRLWASTPAPARRARAGSWPADQPDLDRPHVVAGDFNDPPEAPTTAPLADASSGLVDGLSNAVESAPYLLPEEDPPESTLCTYRQRATGHTTVRLFDHIWVDPETAERKQSAGILRRTK